MVLNANFCCIPVDFYPDLLCDISQTLLGAFPMTLVPPHIRFLSGLFCRTQPSLLFTLKAQNADQLYEELYFEQLIPTV